MNVAAYDAWKRDSVKISNSFIQAHHIRHPSSLRWFQSHDTIIPLLLKAELLRNFASQGPEATSICRTSEKFLDVTLPMIDICFVIQLEKTYSHRGLEDTTNMHDRHSCMVAPVVGR